MKKTLLFLAVVLMGLSMMAQTTYTKVTSESELSAGDKVILVGYNNDGQAFVMSYQKTNNRHAIEIDEAGGSITTVVATSASSQTEAYELTVGGSTGAWTFFDALNNGYLYAPGGGNYLKTQATNDAQGQWTLSMDGDGFVPTSNGGAEQNIMRYNVTSTLFGCYKPSSSVIDLVYIFKEGGTPVIYPEPSNYPSTFYSTVEGTDVILDWTDATGAQLPSKYLVLASTGNITVPQDGTPVADGPLAKNVNYGVQAVTFSGLNGGTTYHFAIFPYTNSGENINYKTNGDYPTATAITENILMLLDEDFNNELGDFTAYNVIGEQVWHQGTYNGKTYANMNGYAGGVYNENEDWLISPEIWIGADIYYESIYMEFSTAMKFDGAPLSVMLSNNYSEGTDPNGADWVDITDAFDYSTGNYEWVESGALDITQYAETNETFHIAFVYTSTSEAASSWEIDYVKVTGVVQLSVGENEAVSFNLYPNPANDNVNIVADRDAKVQIIDMTGRMVMEINVVEGENAVNVSDLESGVYFVKVNGTVVKFVKK